MQYNEFDYDIQVMELPNIVMAVKKPRTPQPTTTHPVLLPLITRLAKARPKWMLVGTDVATDVSDSYKRVATKFELFEGDEALGVIKREYDYGRNESVIGIDNARLRANRQRGHLTRTKDTNKAFKIVTTNFGAKSVTELIDAAYREAASGTRAILSAHRYNYTRTVSALTPSLTSFSAKNWPEFRALAEHERGVTTAMLDRFLEERERDSDCAIMQAALDANEHYTVILRGSEYIIQHKGVTSIFDTGGLTPHLKRCIGMLKLADVGVHVPTMGVKVSDTIMFVMPETTNE